MGSNTVEYTTKKTQENTIHYFVGMRRPGKDADRELFCVGKSFSPINDNTPVKGFWVSEEALLANNGQLGKLIVSQVNKILNKG